MRSRLRRRHPRSPRRRSSPSPRPGRAPSSQASNDNRPARARPIHGHFSPSSSQDRGNPAPITSAPSLSRVYASISRTELMKSDPTHVCGMSPMYPGSRGSSRTASPRSATFRRPGVVVEEIEHLRGRCPATAIEPTIRSSYGVSRPFRRSSRRAILEGFGWSCWCAPAPRESADSTRTGRKRDGREVIRSPHPPRRTGRFHFIFVASRMESFSVCANEACSAASRELCSRSPTISAIAAASRNPLSVQKSSQYECAHKRQKRSSWLGDRASAATARPFIR